MKRTKLVLSGKAQKMPKQKVEVRFSAKVVPNPMVEAFKKDIEEIKALESKSWRYVQLLNPEMLKDLPEPTKENYVTMPEYTNPVTGANCRSRITEIKWLETGLVKKKGEVVEVTRPIYIKPSELMDWNKNKYREASKRKQKLIEQWDGGQTWERGGSGLGVGNTAAYPPSPFTRQLYLQAMWEMQAKCFEIYNHYGIAKAAVNTFVSFVIGDGIKVDFEDEEAQDVWDEFIERTHFDRDLGQYAMMLSVNGEFFFHLPPIAIDGEIGFTDLLSVDPGTVWEVITVPKDIRKVKSYWVQYPTQYQLYTVPGVDFADYIIEQLPPEEVIHVKINVQANEKRGRSDLLASLSDLKRLQEITNYRGVKVINNAALVFDQKITGQDTDVTTIANLPNSFLGPGSTYTHNESSELAIVESKATAEAKSGFHDEQLSQISAGVMTGPAEFIGGGSGSNRANALTKTEPSYKTFRQRQKKLEFTIKDIAKVVIDRWNKAKGSSLDADCEVIFPEIAPEDRKDKLANIVLMESQQYWSHEKAATTAAKEMDDTSYDFESTQQIIQDERLADPQLAFLFTPQAPGAIGGQQNPGGAAPGSDAPKQIGNANPTGPQLGPAAQKLGSPAPTSQYKNNTMGMSGSVKKSIKTQLKQSEAGGHHDLHKDKKTGHKMLHAGFRSRTKHTVKAGEEALAVTAMPNQVRSIDEAEADGYKQEWEACQSHPYAKLDWKESVPTGWEPTVKKMKKHGDIDNPFALANWMDSQGYTPHAGKK